MKIITLTLNPAFDIHCYIEGFKPYHENLAKIISTDAGGKGVNLSRALTAGGTYNLALVVLGEDNADAFRKALISDDMSFAEITVKGKTRENITVHTDGERETRISFEGFTADRGLLDEILKTLIPDLSDAIITFTGRAPLGIGTDDLKDFLHSLKKRGARVVIDSKSLDCINDIAEIGAWLIKPNEEEISMYTDIRVTDTESALLAAERLHRMGIENVMISLGERGAVLYSNEGGYICPAPKITPLSTIGAGDSSIAGFIAAASLGLPKSELLRYAVCYGSAACLTEGTKPPRAEDIMALLKDTEK